MERVGTLIDKLKDQLEHQAGRDKLLITTRLLLAELQQMQSRPSVHGNISVVLPLVMPDIPGVDADMQNAVEKSYAGHPEELSVNQPEKILPVQKRARKEEPTGWLFSRSEVTPPFTEQGRQEQKESQEGKIPWQQKVPKEGKAPQQQESVEAKEQQEPKEVYELNDVILPEEEKSLNDRLKEEKIEIAAILHSAAVRDLRKAIGINDRYLFIRELFRNDENMYERSLKTINAFNIYPEAQYWIQRELKVKLGWDDRSEAVHMFDQLVKRRFS
jgi:hypothetical protein